MNNYYGKDFEIEIANMYLDGMSLREIGEAVGLSHVAVSNHLDKQLPYYNNALWMEVQFQKHARIPKSVDDEEVQERILESFGLLINYDWTIKQIAEDMQVSPNTTYRDLTTRLVSLRDKHPDKVNDSMIMMAASRLESHAKDNLTPGNNGLYETQDRDDYGRFA